jgi:hypothetical protein
MIPARFSARAYSWLAVSVGAVLLASCTSANGAIPASPSHSATPAPTHCTPGGSPPARMGAAMTYDAATKTVVLFGGTRGDGSAPFDDTWTWDGCHWTQAKPATSPPGRSFGAMAFDANSGKVILFGGGAANADPLRNDMWSWDGRIWHEERPSPMPVHVDEVRTVFDTVNRNLVLFGMGGPRFETPVTWSWNGTAWTERHPAKSPPPLYGYGLAFGAKSGIVLFGGYEALDTYRAETWVWDGDQWSRRQPRISPRGGPVFMVHEDTRQDIVLLEDNGMWVWTGDVWQPQHPSMLPPFQYFRSLAYDAARDRVLLFGGKNPQTNQATNDTWLWDGSNWSSVTTS